MWMQLHDQWVRYCMLRSCLPCALTASYTFAFLSLAYRHIQSGWKCFDIAGQPNTEE